MSMALRAAAAAMAAGALFGAAQPASAQQPVNGCPAGQAMQSSDPSGRNITCVPIPNVSALQSQLGGETAARPAGDTQLQNNINAEAASRMGMDAVILQQIQQETADRKAADDALRSSVLEQSIVGSYTFTGPVTCLNASNGFNADLTPKAATSPTANSVISLTHGLSFGTRTFNADGTGHVDVTTHSLNTPSIFYTATNGVGIGFNVSPPNPGGGVSVVDQQGDFTWGIVDGTLYITEPTITGTFTQGNRAGWSTTSSGTPRAVGVLGKDLRTIVTRNEDAGVETTLQTPGAGQSGQPLTGFRICTRERTYRKL
jgi:hypothetical protein